MTACWAETRRTGMVLVVPPDDGAVRVAKLIRSRPCPGCGENEHLVRFACGTEMWCHEHWLFPDVAGGHAREIAQLSPLVGRA